MYYFESDRTGRAEIGRSSQSASKLNYYASTRIRVTLPVPWRQHRTGMSLQQRGL